MYTMDKKNGPFIGWMKAHSFMVGSEYNSLFFYK